MGNEKEDEGALLLNKHGLTESVISRFKPIFKLKRMEKGDYFIRQGDMSVEMGFVEKGLFRSFYLDGKGNDVTKYFYPEGSMLFSYAAHLAQSPSAYSVQALEDGEIYIAPIIEFERLIKGDYELMEHYKRIIDEMLVTKEAHALSFKLLDGIGRYKAFITENPGLERRVKQYHLATYLGITPVSLCRIRKKAAINK
jgi:CRP-like cAMP-binding protein